MNTSIATSATASTLRPKNMKQLYGRHKVYLLRNGDVWHLLHAVYDWAALADKFGQQVGHFDPFASMGAGGWFMEVESHGMSLSQRITIKALLSKIGNGEVCMLGKDCHKHRG